MYKSVCQLRSVKLYSVCKYCKTVLILFTCRKGSGIGPAVNDNEQFDGFGTKLPPIKSRLRNSIKEEISRKYCKTVQSGIGLAVNDNEQFDGFGTKLPPIKSRLRNSIKDEISRKYCKTVQSGIGPAVNDNGQFDGFGTKLPPIESRLRNSIKEEISRKYCKTVQSGIGPAVNDNVNTCNPATVSIFSKEFFLHPAITDSWY